MDSHTLIQALIYLGSAALIVPIAVRLGLGSVLGYLIAGCIIGPWGLRLVTDAEAILHFAEIGVVLMLFVIGLELDPQRLWKLRASVFGGGALQMVVRRADWPVLHAAGDALAGGGADRHDAGALLDGDRHAGDERT
jgi:glutathione-regulated potassium-efflux system ancillary protein KefC